MKSIFVILIALSLITLVGLVVYNQSIHKDNTSFCDSASLESGSNYPVTCYETPQSWIDEGKIYKGTKLEAKK